MGRMIEAIQEREAPPEPTSEVVGLDTGPIPAEVTDKPDMPTTTPDFIRGASFGRILLMEAGYTRRNLPLIRF